MILNYIEGQITWPLEFFYNIMWLMLFIFSVTRLQSNNKKWGTTITINIITNLTIKKAQHLKLLITKI